MSRTLWIASLFLGSTVGLWPADAEHGAIVLRDQNCLACHTVNGLGAARAFWSGSPRAPDLGGKIVAEYTPAGLAAALWNHAPAMWKEMEARGVKNPEATNTDWEDLFAYLYSVQFLEGAGDVGHGANLFQIYCVTCHSVSKSTPRLGAALPDWKPLNDPVDLLYRMWDHASTMNAEFAAQKKTWPQFNGQDYMDLERYVRSTQNLLPQRSFKLPPAAAGQSAFTAKCRSCHIGPDSLEKHLVNNTWQDIGAGMWNHVPLMKKLPVIGEEEMKQILAYVWEVQYQGPKANLADGEDLFKTKGCVACHRSPGNGEPISPRFRQTFTPFSMIALGWGRGRTMHEQMLAKGMEWPKLTDREMADVVAYLTRISRD